MNEQAHQEAPSLPALTEAIADALLQRGEWLAVAESCTGGLIAQQLTERPGSSGWFERGVVTYSNAAKQALLGVPSALIAQHGAVSREVAEAMAQGLLERAPVQWTLAVTGIAGPGGGSIEKPVGLVWIAWARARIRAESQAFQFFGDRSAIRSQAAAAALAGLEARLRQA